MKLYQIENKSSLILSSMLNIIFKLSLIGPRLYQARLSFNPVLWCAACQILTHTEEDSSPTMDWVSPSSSDQQSKSEALLSKNSNLFSISRLRCQFGITGCHHPKLNHNLQTIKVILLTLMSQLSLPCPWSQRIHYVFQTKILEGQFPIDDTNNYNGCHLLDP